MKSDSRRHWRLIAAVLLVWSCPGFVAWGAETADVEPAPVADVEGQAAADRSDATPEQAASEPRDTAVQPGEVRALRDRIEATETQIQLLKSVVIQALRAQSAAEAALRREREARDAAPGPGPGTTESQGLILADQLEALTDSLDRLREDVAALRTEARTDLQPAGDATRNVVPSSAFEETEAVPGAEADPLAESGVGGEYAPLIEDEPVAAAFNSAAAGSLEDQIEVAQVHFNPGSAELTPGGHRKTLEAVERIKAMEPAKVRVVGYADTMGDAGDNRRLSAQRARSIAAMLERVGLRGDMVEIVGRGEDGIPEPTADQVSEPYNRCAGIFVVMNSPK